MRFILLFLILILAGKVSFSQPGKARTKEFALGALIPVGKEISAVYDQGIAAEFRFTKSFTDFIDFKPYINYSFFGNKPNDYSREELHFLSLGIIAAYKCVVNPNVSIYLGPALNANYYRDNIVFKDVVFMPFSKKRNNLMSDFFFFCDARLGVEFKRILVELSFRPYWWSKPHISEKVVAATENGGELFQLYRIKDRKFDLSIFAVSLGIKL